MSKFTGYYLIFCDSPFENINKSYPHKIYTSSSVNTLGVYFYVLANGNITSKPFEYSSIASITTPKLDKGFKSLFRDSLIVEESNLMILNNKIRFDLDVG